MRPCKIAEAVSVRNLQPFGFQAEGVDLVLIRNDDEVSVLYGRCLHRGALMQDGAISGDDIICGVHNWDYNWKSGVSAYNNAEALHKIDSSQRQMADSLRKSDKVTQVVTSTKALNETFRGLGEIQRGLLETLVKDRNGRGGTSPIAFVVIDSVSLGSMLLMKCGGPLS